jgi:hypothetical protein
MNFKKAMLLAGILSSLLICGISSCVPEQTALNDSQTAPSNGIELTVKNISVNISIESNAGYKHYDSILDKSPAYTIGGITTPMVITNPIFYTNHISYSFIGCESFFSRREEMVRAFNRITNLTKGKLTFFDRGAEDEKADIKVHCMSTSEAPTTHTTETTGQGGPTGYYPINEYSIIVGGEIYIYNYECSGDSSMQLHELFHVLGFDHVNRPDDIMYYLSKNCDTSIGAETMGALNQLYGIYKRVNGTKIIDYPSDYFRA